MLAGGAGSPDEAEYQSVLIRDVPHVHQKPDFCGEACGAMWLKRLGQDVDQDYVFDASGLRLAFERSDLLSKYLLPRICGRGFLRLTVLPEGFDVLRRAGLDWHLFLRLTFGLLSLGLCVGGRFRSSGLRCGLFSHCSSPHYMTAN